MSKPILSFNLIPEPQTDPEHLITYIQVRPLDIELTVQTKPRESHYSTHVSLFNLYSLPMYDYLSSNPSKHKEVVVEVCRDLTNQDPLLLHRVKSILTYIYMDAV